jgi:hypothetical protein
MRASKIVAAVAIVFALLAVPAAAQATLAYVKGYLHRSVYVAADSGSGARKLGPGSSPHVSPDGTSIAYLHEGSGNAQELKLAPAGGGASRTLLKDWREPFHLAFAPDSKTIAALRGPEIGKRKLVLIDVASGRQKVVASGYFGGFSFSPDGGELAYSTAASDR